jgi:type I restriction enzyme S subunit
LLAQGVYAFRLDQEQVLPDYFVWLSNNETFRAELRRYTVGSTQIHMRVPVYRNLDIPIPPIAAQRIFAQRIAQVNGLHEAQGKHLEKSERLFTSLQHIAFSKQLRGITSLRSALAVA